MKMTKKIFVLLLTLMLSITAVVPAFAQVAPETATCPAGETVEVTFSYENIKGIHGTFVYSDRDMVADVAISFEGIDGVRNGDMIALSGVVEADCAITLTITLAEDVQAGDQLTVEFRHEISYSKDNVVSDLVDTAVITVPGKATVDYTDLRYWINVAEGLNPGEYTVDSWDAVDTALTAAYIALESDNQDVVDAAAKALKDAVLALVPVGDETVNYSELEAQIAIAEGLNEKEYTSVSWDVLKVALENAYLALESEDQTVVDQATDKLKEAIAALVKMDYTELNKQIAIAQGLKKADYTSKTWKKMASALEEAIAARESRDQDVVDAAAKALKDAIKGLKKVGTVSIDYSELEAQIAIAEALNKDEYTAVSWAVLEAALADAIEARTAEVQAVVDDAAQSLADAIAALVKMDYSKLEAQITIAQGLKKDEYTPDTWAVLEAALVTAIEARASKDQAVVDAAADALEKAIADLKKVAGIAGVDYTELNRQILIAQGLEEKDYTAESWANMKKALKVALAARESDDQAVVDAAAKGLADAIAALELAPEGINILWIILIALVVVNAVVFAIIFIKKKKKSVK